MAVVGWCVAIGMRELDVVDGCWMAAAAHWTEFAVAIAQRAQPIAHESHATGTAHRTKSGAMGCIFVRRIPITQKYRACALRTCCVFVQREGHRTKTCATGRLSLKNTEHCFCTTIAQALYFLSSHKKTVLVYRTLNVFLFDYMPVARIEI